MKILNLLKTNTLYILFFALVSIQYFSNATTYCVPSTVSGCSAGDRISFFSLRGESGTLISNGSGVTCNTTPLAYSDFTSGFSIPLLTESITYSGFLQTGNENDYATIWIDFNNDGIFADSERLLDNLKIGTSNLLYGIRIPTGSTLGQHRLRVRIIGSPTKPVAITDPCTEYNFSETEDYLVEITNTEITKEIAPGIADACTEISQMTINAASNNNGSYPVYLVDSDNKYAAAIYPDGNNLGTVHPSFYINNSALPIRQDLSGKYYLDRNLTISVESQPTTTYRFRYFFKLAELNEIIAQPGSGITSQFDLVMTKTGDNTCSNQVYDIVGVPNQIIFPVGFGSLSGDRFLDFTGLTSFSSFFLHGGSTVLDGNNIGNPLPVNLISFSVENFEKSINKLQWQVSDENSLTGYEIQKSDDGQIFEKIGFVNSSQSELYSYLYQSSATSTHTFFRLKMLDFDGKFSFSKIIHIINEPNYDLKIYPNPVNSFLTIEKYGSNTFEIFDSKRRLVKSEIYENNNKINVEGLPAGIYFLKIGSSFKKFVKN